MLIEKIKSHPIGLVVSSSVAAALFCVSVGGYLHNSVIEQKNATIELLRTEIDKNTKSKGNSNKQKFDPSTIGSVPKNSTSKFLSYSNERLRAESLSMTRRLRRLIKDLTETRTERIDKIKESNNSSRELVKKERERVKLEFLDRYESEFMIDSILFLKELQVRNSKKIDIPDWAKPIYSFQRHGWGETELVKLANILESNAKLLSN